MFGRKGRAYGEKRLLIGKRCNIVVEASASIRADDAIYKLLTAREYARGALLDCHFR